MSNFCFEMFSGIDCRVFFANTVAVFRGRGRKRGNPTMATSMVTARRKRDPQYYVEVKMGKWNKYLPKMICWGRNNENPLFVDRLSFEIKGTD